MAEVVFKNDIGVELVQKIGGDEEILMAAKVATKGLLAVEDATSTKIEGLIRYLMKQRHGTPFECNAMTFLIHAPIFVFREWHRHRIGWSYNEESGRYKTLDPVFYLPVRDRPMMKVEDWKPGRPKFTVCQDDETYESLCASLKQSYALAYRNYEFNLNLGIDPGLARDCLPVGIYSSMFATCNARSLMHFLSLRTFDEKANHTSYPLYEIEVAARKMEEIFAKLFPITHKAYADFGRECP
jgi:thymidylate synthase (FAD)